MPKINIGAGTKWYKDGWDILDNGAGSYSEPWKHFGKIWDSHLPSDTYDIVFTSHTLEHVPHFKIEKTIAELNRILKIGGTLRISVPDLEKAVKAYLNKDISYFKNEDSRHTSDHLGFGSMLLNQIISPGQQTFAFNRDMEPVGSYGHTYNYDFTMFEILLEKWGFDSITKSEYCKSAIEELREPTQIVWDSNAYSINDRVGIEKLKNDNSTYVTGFDNKPSFSLYVEATKSKTIKYKKSLEFEYTTRNNIDNERLWRLKGIFFQAINKIIDKLYAIYSHRK